MKVIMVMFEMYECKGGKIMVGRSSLSQRQRQRRFALRVWMDRIESD